MLFAAESFASLVFLSQTNYCSCLKLYCTVLQAAEFGTEMLDEDGLFDLIRRLPAKKSKYQIAAENERSQVSAKVITLKYFIL